MPVVFLRKMPILTNGLINCNGEKSKKFKCKVFIILANENLKH